MASPPPPTPPPAAPPPNSSPSQGQSNLYLVTFLATLSLLLFISCAIILRSYFLRRRHHRFLDDAFDAGLLLTPRAQGSKRKRFGAKPKITDTWLAHGGEKWDSLMPLCAQPVFVKRRYRHGQGPGPSITIPNATATPPSAPETNPLRHRLRTFFDRRQPTPPPAEPDINPQSPALELPPAKTTSGTYKVRVEMLQISVLIAMPSPARSIRKNASLDRMRVHPGPSASGVTYELADESDDDEDDQNSTVLPELVFGLARVNCPKPRPSQVASTTTTTTTPVVVL